MHKSQHQHRNFGSTIDVAISKRSDMTDLIQPTGAKLPEECNTMLEVRAGVDATDDALVALLARRFSYMDAAARIKKDRNTVRDEARKAEVILNAKTRAQDSGLPIESIAQIWDMLVETSIAYEMDEWDRLNP